MKNICIVFFLFFVNQVFFQNKEYSNPQKAFIEVFGKCFDDLAPIEGTINILPEKKNVRFCSLYQCASRIVYAEEEKDIENAILKRAKEIAIRLYNQGTPIYLTYGMNSSAQADLDNEILTDDDHLVYISVGECIVFQPVAKLSEEVNKVTMELINNYKAIKQNAK
ncbi:hypothetical protein K6T82_00280 [Flavobacterium sp. 17A]|uniref:Uncharacterized protein n=1 Tax=Flavobacterium potami TaxID=2872310 RepID=A0A9X1H5Q0_9FLAO|nr:hypothetical protein [Flavobacterium potami]MBZ4033185.1 hypothetical protein [Flavobacterium potami]